MNNPTLSFSQTALPVLADCDVLVIGASFAGVAAALKLARAGKRVTLIESRTYPGSELTATLRTWLEDTPAACPDWFTQLVTDCGTATASGEIALNPDSLKIQLEDLLLAANVQLLYAAFLVDVLPHATGYSAIIGSKGGRQIIHCQQLIDATAEAISTRLQQSHVSRQRPAEICAFTLEFDGVAGLTEQDFLPAPAALELEQQRFVLHRGYRSPQHYLLECHALFPAVPDDSFGESLRLARKSQLAIDSTAYLMQQPAFKTAYLAGISYELHPLTAPSVLQRIHTGEVLAADILQGKAPLLTVFADAENDSQPALEICELPASKSAHVQTVPPRSVPLLREVDVLVVGGGTSGATSAYIAGKQGMHTLLVEMNPGLGGTGTFGGVHSYWFGRRVGFSAQLSERVNALHTRLGHREAQGVLPKWNIEIKAHTLLRDALDVGVEVLLNTTTIAVLREGAAVCGIVVATRAGIMALKAKIVIDATGDADIATQAGAHVVYGSERDHTTMWYALAQFARPGLTQNHFTSTVDVSDVQDYTRAILAGRRRRRNDNMHDHGLYIAPRESRHIRGAVVLTLTDQLLRRAWEDTINIPFSNHDIKGHTTADWLRVGLIPPNLLIEIPYRALLPDNLENIIVVGKAISATHDALPAIRMQADLENLGGVAGMAASLAIRQGIAARNIPIRTLQEQLVAVDVLPPEILSRTLQPRQYDDRQLQTLVQRVANDQPLYLYADMDLVTVYEGDLPLVELTCSGAAAVEQITAQLEQASPAGRLKLALALALMGSSAARPLLVQALTERLDADPLPRRSVHIHHTQLPPDQGAMPEECNWLYALGMVADASALPIWSRLIDQLSEVDSDDLRDELKGVFYYVDSVCAGIERLGSPQAIDLLRRLHQNPIFCQQMSATGFQVDYFLERQAYLELVIARALARCGSVEGYRILIDYLGDSRALLARHALSELRNLTGTQAGYERAFWETWLHEHAAQIKPQPLPHDSEIQAYWQQTILQPRGFD